VTATLATPDTMARVVELSSIGFLTVLNEGNAYVGGYLVTNVWGRPLEFRLTSAVQPNRVQQILYAETLIPYLCSDLIGKTLIDKTSGTVQLVVTDRAEVLDLRRKVDYPVICLAGDPPATEGQARRAHSLLCHPDYPDDSDWARRMLKASRRSLDLLEPFGRIREAIAEARKLGRFSS
jgi:hypothetical protein